MTTGFEFFELVKSQCTARKIMNKVGDTILEIAFPEDGKVRSRKIVTRSRARATGKYPSWKMGRMIEWESHNELNAFRLLDANPEALAYHEQPLHIKFVLHGEEHTHYPDVLVQWGGSRELWEIKPEAEASLPHYAERTRFLEAALPQLGFSYRVVLAEELAKQPRLSNVLTLLKHGRPPVGELAQEQARQLLSATSFITWQSALDQFGATGRAVVARLTLEGTLVCDMEHALTPSTPFSLNARRPA